MTFEEFIEQMKATAPEGVTFRSSGNERAEFLYSDFMGFKHVVSIDTCTLSSDAVEISMQSYGPSTEIFLSMDLCAWLGTVKEWANTLTR